MLVQSVREGLNQDGGGCALIVDDNQDTREILGALLDDLGFSAEVAINGEEALAYIGHKIPDLIVLDIMMPRLDGFSVLARLHGNPLTRHIPVVVITALSSEQIERFKLPGVIGTFQKGRFNLASIQALVADVLHVGSHV